MIVDANSKLSEYFKNVNDCLNYLFKDRKDKIKCYNNYDSAHQVSD